jgi:phytoene synthase
MRWWLADNYAACRDLTRRSARNFYYSFWILPKYKRLAMCALYAFFRRTDDLGDDPGPIEERRAKLAAWREMLHRGLEDDDYRDLMIPAIVDTIRGYSVPTEYLETAIDGVESDLDRNRFATFDELSRYCYQVASVVGLASIHVWGFENCPAAFKAAEDCGVAFQLTNILRDVAEDAARGRIYLPQDEMARFGVTDDDLIAGRVDDRMRALFRFQCERTEDYYRRDDDLKPYLSADGLDIYSTMVDIYRALFDKVRSRDGDVFSERVRLSAWHKTALAVRRLAPRLLRLNRRDQSLNRRNGP